jgi:hypothetical protein
MKYRVLRSAGAIVQCLDCVRAFTHPTEIEANLSYHCIDEVQYDHHLALVDGGKHSVENLRPICSVHHARKSAREHIANCKAKRLANPKPSKHPMKSSGRKIPAHVNPWGKR